MFVNRLTCSLHLCALCMLARLVSQASSLLLFQKYKIILRVHRLIMYLGFLSALICKAIATGSRPCIKAKTKRTIQGERSGV